MPVRSNLPRWIVAILIVGVAVVASLYLGALSQFATGVVSWQAVVAAPAVFAVGIVAAIVVVRGGPTRRM
jgi:hypothetical protein